MQRVHRMNHYTEKSKASVQTRQELTERINMSETVVLHWIVINMGIGQDFKSINLIKDGNGLYS